jgi:fatty-acyl-CoA synthase
MYLFPMSTNAAPHPAFSYVRGKEDPPLMGVTIGECFDRVAATYFDRDALIVPDQGVRWTYAQLHSRVTALAAGLVRLGLRPGDRLGIWSQNRAEWVLTQFAAAKAGLILVNINPAYQAAELKFALRKVGCKALIVAPRCKNSDLLAILGEVVPELRHATAGDLRCAALPALRHVIRLGDWQTAGMINFSELLRLPDEKELGMLIEYSATLECTDAVNIQFTSGATGTPKGATLSHHNLLNNGFFAGEAMRLTCEDRVCIPVPLYHGFGMVIGNLACITHGAAMVFPGEGFEPRAVLETIQAERCTGLHGVPTMFIALLGHPQFSQYDLSSLRTGVMAGSPCPVEVMKRVVHQMHMEEVTIGHGMTETAPISFQSASDDPPARRELSFGRIQPHLEVKIVDEQGNLLPRGTPGELLTRGYSVMLGYWGDAERTSEAIDAEGWMHTGELATLDADGYCNIVGRLKAISNSENDRSGGGAGLDSGVRLCRAAERQA